MNRSDSLSSTSSKNSSSEPFAYQRRLMERTSSISRATPVLSSTVLSPTATPTGSRRWTSHRVTNSIDSVRGKWEERARTESLANRQPSPTRNNVGDYLDDTPRRLNGQHNDNRGDYTDDTRKLPPVPSKRYTLPDPIIASPLSPNSTGITITNPDTTHASMASLLSPQRSSIHLPSSGSSVSSSKRLFDDSLASTTPSSTRGSISSVASSSRSQRSIDFDAIMSSGDEPTRPTRTPAGTSTSTSSASPW